MADFGNKINRLIKLKQNPIFSSKVPDFFPYKLENYNGSTEKKHIIQYLKEEEIEGLVAKELGEPPYIIRSSGQEDTDSFNINAGKYISKIVYRQDTFLDDFHMVLTQNDTEIIPIFVQKLVYNQREVDSSYYVPYLSDISILVHLLEKVHSIFQYSSIDCEWCIKTAEGTLISVTSHTAFNKNNQIEGEVSFGFGVGSAQNLYSNVNSRLYIMHGENSHLWEGERFLHQTYSEQDLFLLQIRPIEYALTQKVRIPIFFSDENYFCTYDDILLLGNELNYGPFIFKHSLQEAWLFFENHKKLCRKTKYVLVNNGSPLEHAGIMFRALKITVLKISDHLSFETNNLCCCVDIYNKRIYFLSNDQSIDEITFQNLDYFNISANAQYICPNPSISLKQYTDMSKVQQEEILKNTMNHHTTIRYKTDEKPTYLTPEMIYKVRGYINEQNQFLTTCEILFIHKNKRNIRNIEQLTQILISCDLLSRSILREHMQSVIDFSYNVSQEIMDYIDKLVSKWNQSLIFQKIYIDVAKLNSYPFFIMIEFVETILKEPYITSCFEEVMVFLRNTYSVEDDVYYVTCFKKVYEFLVIENPKFAGFFYYEFINQLDLKGKYLLSVFVSGDVSVYQKYQKLLFAWNQLFSILQIENNLSQLDYSTDLRNIFLEGYSSIEDLYTDVVKGDYRFENLHQIHNFLHQISLYRKFENFDGNSITNKIVSVIGNTKNSYLMRYNQQLIEIFLGISVHKTSILITNNSIEIEYSEAPGNAFSSRLYVFSEMFKYLNIDNTIHVTSSIFRDFGTWKILVKISSQHKFPINFSIFIMEYTIMLVNISFDFSGVEMTELSKIPIIPLTQPQWLHFAQKIIEYIGKIPVDSFIPYKSLYISHLLTWISTDCYFQEIFLFYYQKTYQECLSEYKNLEEKLFIEDYPVWKKYYQRCIILTILLVVKYPEFLLDTLNEIEKFPFLKKLFGLNVFFRE